MPRPSEFNFLHIGEINNKIPRLTLEVSDLIFLLIVELNYLFREFLLW